MYNYIYIYIYSHELNWTKMPPLVDIAPDLLRKYRSKARD